MQSRVFYVAPPSNDFNYASTSMLHEKLQSYRLISVDRRLTLLRKFLDRKIIAYLKCHWQTFLTNYFRVTQIKKYVWASYASDKQDSLNSKIKEVIISNILKTYFYLFQQKYLELLVLMLFIWRPSPLFHKQATQRLTILICMAIYKIIIMGSTAIGQVHELS